MVFLRPDAAMCSQPEGKSTLRRIPGPGTESSFRSVSRRPGMPRTGGQIDD